MLTSSDGCPWGQLAN